eukprot:8180129-Pyramimonas_sp.AAC.1
MSIGWSRGCPADVRDQPLMALRLSCGCPMVVPWLFRGCPVAPPPVYKGMIPGGASGGGVGDS